ncbi:MAG: hypothetical protein R3E39_26765 [Anaerolineae bacterium]
MNADIFAEWLRLQYHTVVRTENSYWYDSGPRVYQAFPYHWLISPDEKEVNGFLTEHKAIGLRYSTPLESAVGAHSYHAIYDGTEYHLELLGKSARKNIRRGLKNCRVEPVTFELLADEGWNLQLDTLDRQGRELRLTKSTWERRMLAARDLPGFEAWGAFVGNHLGASVITFTMDDWLYMLYQQCRREYLPQHVNNALSFVVTQTMIERKPQVAILYGLHSLDAPPSVDEFKFRMGYRAKAVRQRVAFHPTLSPLFNRASHLALKHARRWMPNNPTLAKMEGMIRFYLQGKQPLDEQPYPPSLSSSDGDLYYESKN